MYRVWFVVSILINGRYCYEFGYILFFDYFRCGCLGSNKEIYKNMLIVLFRDYSFVYVFIRLFIYLRSEFVVC